MVSGLNDDKKQIKLESWKPGKRKVRNKGKKGERVYLGLVKRAEILKVILC